MQKNKKIFFKLLENNPWIRTSRNEEGIWRIHENLTRTLSGFEILNDAISQFVWKYALTIYVTIIF